LLKYIQSQVIASLNIAQGIYFTLAIAIPNNYQADALTMSADALTMSADPLAMSADPLAMSADTFVM
jgi:hypothetical protein